jgi:ubiquinone/menaquinone biosynthesis C-methylase UbiE
MSKKFWDKEYSKPTHLALSTEPGEDLETFARWAVRNSEWHPFPKGGEVIDIGCGNGRNLIFICKEFNMRGYGIDISDTAIAEANKMKDKLEITFKAGSMSEKLPQENESVDVVLDMMASHFMNKDEREKLLAEIVRVMKPYGWFFMKTFVMDGDTHAKRLINEYPGKEENTYIHPKMGVPEHVWTEAGIHEFLAPYFKIHKKLKSYKHVTKDGKPYKRRTISVYAEKLG